jgi:DHA1 family bicyclomycin/chloramphenicol resistance-like MFS transporter
MNGLSPILYSVDFAANATRRTIAALVAARLAGRVSTRKVILVGQIAALTAGIVMLIGAILFDTPLMLAIVCFFVLMTAQGLIGPNRGALASAAVPEHPGTGSASSASSSGWPPVSSRLSPASAANTPRSQWPPS